MSGRVLVTGASGNVGSATVHALRLAGVPVRAAGTDPQALEQRYPGVRTVRLDFREAATFDAALDGVDGVFLMRPPTIAAVGATVNAFLDAAVRRRVRHVVFSSVTGADTNRLVPHHRVETHLHRSTLSWTILRPGFFAQNLAGAYLADLRRDDRIHLPAGHRPVAFIDTRDIGDVAAVVFADPAAHRGAGYVLTGPQAVTFDEVAATLTRHLGRPISYQPASVPGYVRHLHRQGLPVAQVLVQTVLHTGLRRGQGQAVNPTLGHLLGRAPRTLEQYIHDHRTTWAPQPPM